MLIMKYLSAVFLFIIISSLLSEKSYPAEYAHVISGNGKSYAAAKSGVRGGDLIPLQKVQTGLTAAVFGFLPGNLYLKERNYIRYDLLTHIACTDFSADSLGNLKEPAYWPWTDVINKAHENGVKIIVCTSNFSESQMHYLLNSESAKQNLFVNLKDELINYKLDGVNVDFERFYPSDCGSLLNEFMAELTSYLHKEVPGSEISFDGPHYNWGGLWNFKGLADACDYIFIMGYAYAGSFSQTTGATAPMVGAIQNLKNTVMIQYGAVTKNEPEKLILGVPFYGNKWFTKTPDPHVPVVSFLSFLPYYKSIAGAEVCGLQWDDVQECPWYTWRINDTTWCQVWFDNDSSLGLKYDLAIKYKLKGVGMWALGYEGTGPDLWNGIADHFSVTGIRHENSNLPSFDLMQNYPNPFNPSTVISYRLAADSKVLLKIYDILGRTVATLVDQEQAAGGHQEKFDASNLSSGIYICTLRAGNYSTSKKMILLK